MRTAIATSDLLSRVREQHTVSSALHERTRSAVAVSRRVQAAVRARVLCDPVRQLGTGDFRLRGTVGGQDVAALWSGGELDASAALLQQAGLVVALGDVLGDGRPAGLGDSRSALLTLARACDRVRHVELGVGRPEPVR